MSISSEMTDQQRIQKVRTVVTQAGEELRERHPILKHQDFIGASILVFALSGMLGCAALYAYGVLPAWACIPLIAIFASLTHELEHDLIHYMYFKKNKVAHHIMMSLVWLARPNTISPWTRRRMHLHHHKFSGTEHDLEERGIGNGMPWGLRRILITSDQLMTVYLRPIQMLKMLKLFVSKQPENERRRTVISQILGFIPLGLMYYGLWYCFVIFHVVDHMAVWFGSAVGWSSNTLAAMKVVNFLAVVWVIPNFIRSFSLQFISSNMHYYGDIDPRDVIKQTQVLTPWWLLPFQIFCCNFGSTHAIHHFVVKEPFYIRQMTSKTAHKVMREVGVRFNDYGTFKRVNRWNKA